MFYVVSRFVTLFSSPVVYWLLFLLLAVFLNNRRGKLICIWITVCLFLLFTNKWLYMQAERWWVRDIASPPKTEQVYTYGVVLGGFADYNPQVDRFDFNRSADRLWEAVQLYKQGRIRKLVIASDGSTNPEYGNPQTFIRQMSNLDIPATDVLIEPKARNTDENATYILRMLPDLRTEPFLLITSAVHMPRSLYCFRKLGLEPDYYATDLYYQPMNRWENWVPDITLLEEWYALGHEVIGMYGYRFRQK